MSVLQATLEQMGKLKVKMVWRMLIQLYVANLLYVAYIKLILERKFCYDKIITHDVDDICIDYISGL